MPGVELTGVVDINRARADEIAAATGTKAYTGAPDIASRLDVDAVTIAVPTDAHAEVALPFLERGVATLIEKPMARSIAEADAMIAAAARSGATFGVGHTERYNPAVVAALPRVTTPRFAEVHRLGVFPERSLDIDVVFDLMIHDLDVILAFVQSEVASIEAVGVPVLTPRVDIANARIRFASGCIANLTASRISRDYAAQEVETYELVRRDGERPAIEGGKMDVARQEPLARELADFVRAAQARSQPLVDGAAGRRALALAVQVAQAMDIG